MTSLETDGPNELGSSPRPAGQTPNDDVPARSEPATFFPRKPGPWIAAAVIIGVPAIITGIGAITSPPSGLVPVGHILYLDADQPSEKTTMLHDMYSVGAGGSERLITHEEEPQDVDAGAREWIVEPACSPDGKLVAFVKEMIVIEEEKQSVDNQIWVADADAPKETSGRLLLDLTANKLDQVTGLSWTPDGDRVAFLDDGVLYIPPVSAKAVAEEKSVTDEYKGISPLSVSSAQYDLPADVHPPANGISSTALVGIMPDISPICLATKTGAVLARSSDKATPFSLEPLAIGDGYQAASPSPNRARLAVVKAGSTKIDVLPLGVAGAKRTYDARFGWSMFGHQKVTSLHWSPDGRYIGYTVSKPPIAENEVFYVDTSTGNCYKLPFRCGPSSWTWSQ